MECGNCGFSNPPDQFICDQCSAVVQCQARDRRSTYALMLMLLMMISLAAAMFWLRI